jgi:hypothetical protein
MADDGPNPKQRRSREDLWWGLGLGVFGLVLLVGVLIPNYVRPPGGKDPRMACIANLRIIDAAKEQWAIDTHAPSNSIPNWNDIRPYLLGRDGTNNVIPKCPSGGVYTIGALSNAPTCSVKGHNLQ